MMICPNCDSGVREGEVLIISHTRSDGFFSVKHAKRREGIIFDKSVNVCKPGWYNKLSIDVTSCGVINCS